VPVRLQAAQTRRRRVLAVAVAAAVVVVDQLTKTWALRLPPTVIAGQQESGRHVLGTVYLELTFNFGAAFGLGRGVTPIVEAVVAVLLMILLLAGRRASRWTGTVASVGFGLVVGGALGNLTDRVLRHNGGAVIDFINVAQVGRRELWPVFNVADACIVVGAFLLAYEYSRKPAPARGPAAPAESRGPDA
jgi:signal peptidase II